MPSEQLPKRELLELVAAARDDALTADGRRRLEELLESNPEARDYFLRFMTLHALLETRLTADVPDTDDRVAAEVTGSGADCAGSHRGGGFGKIIFAVAASLLVAVVGYFGYHQYRPAIDQPVALATITDLEDAKWVPAADARNLGDAVSPGWIRLDSGLVRLSYRHGVVVTLEGPAEYEIRSLDEAILRRGRLAAYVPDGAEGFHVSTPNAKVVDLGTEFGLTVSDHGETELSVFDGKVELTPAVPQSKTHVVSSGLAYRVDTQGQTHQELISLAPYRDARDSLCRWRMVWEPFGPGSGQAFPGRAGRGWLDAWAMDVENGSITEDRTGVFDEPTLFPGTEKFLSVEATAAEDTEPCRVKVARSFGSIDRFTTTERYTIEFLLRLDCDPADVRRIRVFGTARKAATETPPLWQFEAIRASLPQGRLAWQLGDWEEGESHDRTLPVREGMSFRCFVGVRPQLGLWRATVSNRRVSISNALERAPRLTGNAAGPMTLSVEVEGREGRDVRFSLDAVRIQNRPDGLASGGGQ